MIENDKQLENTKAWIVRFQAEIETFDKDAADVHPLLLQAEKDGMRSKMEDLQKQVDEYENRKR